MNSRECRVIIRYRFITEYSWSQFSNKPLGSKKSKAIIFPKILNLLLPYISTGHYTHEGLRTIYHERSSQRKLIPKIVSVALDCPQNKSTSRDSSYTRCNGIAEETFAWRMNSKETASHKSACPARVYEQRSSGGTSSRTFAYYKRAWYNNLVKRTRSPADVPKERPQSL